MSFQSTAFQQDAFQVDVGVVPPPAGVTRPTLYRPWWNRARRGSLWSLLLMLFN